MYQDHKQKGPGNNRCLKYIRSIFAYSVCTHRMQCEDQKVTEVWGRNC